MEFRYADKEQQLIRTNSFVALANTVYYAYVMLMLVASLVRGERSPGFCGMIAVIALVSLAVLWIVFLRNKKSTLFRQDALTNCRGFCATQNLRRKRQGF